MAQLRIQNLTKTFRDRKRKIIEAVKDVSLEVGDGEFLVIVGPSGCGKSTLLRLIAGLEEADSGSIQIDGQDVTNVHPKDRDVAMVFQNYALFPHMTVFENMAFSLRFRKVAKDKIRERVQQAAEMLHLEELLERRPQELSGGQRQRVAVGRAIVRHPKLFLFDEPLSNLDAKMRTELRAELSRLHQRLETTMIYVTHDQMEAMTLGSRICVLNEGRIMQTGAPLEVYRSPSNTFVAGFIGNPGANLLRGQLAKVDSHLEFRFDGSNGCQSIRLGDRFHAIVPKGTNQEVILGIRPEGIRVTQNEPIADHGGTLQLQGILELNETIGHEALLHLRIGTDVVKARASADQGFKLNQPASVTLDSNGIRMFDAQTGEAIPVEQP